MREPYSEAFRADRRKRAFRGNLDLLLPSAGGPHSFEHGDVWGTHVGYDTITLVVKEFWPDIRRHLRKPHAGYP
jgi:hypothetical protein